MAFRFTGFTDEAGKPLEEQISVAKETGWNSIEIRLVGDKNVCDLSDDEWGHVWGRLREEGITVAGFGGQIANWARPITGDFQLDMAELTRNAPRMKEAGTNLLRIMSYPNDTGNPWPNDKWKAEAVRRLRELARVAEDLGVILGHENCSGYGGIGPDQYLELVEAVDSPALKLIFDTGNTGSHDDDVEASWRYYEKCRDQIVHVHIKSFKRNDEGKLVTCYPDEDPVQRRVFDDLVATGYDGWISIEPHMAAAVHEGKSADSEGRARAIWVEYARRIDAMVASL